MWAVWSGVARAMPKRLSYWRALEIEHLVEADLRKIRGETDACGSFQFRVVATAEHDAHVRTGALGVGRVVGVAEECEMSGVSVHVDGERRVVDGGVVVLDVPVR